MSIQSNQLWRFSDDHEFWDEAKISLSFQNLEMATYLKKMKLSYWAIHQLRNNTSHKNWENLETTEPKVAVTSEMKLQVRLKLQNNMIPKLESNLNLFENET